MKKELDNFIAESEQIKDFASFELLRTKMFGKTGLLNSLTSQIKDMSPEGKKEFGESVKNLRMEIEQNLQAIRNRLDAQALQAKLDEGAIDITLPVSNHTHGSIHPVSYVMNEMVEIFASLGFDIKDGPDIEDEYHNFTALGIGENHPARQMQDSFYLPSNMVLRTHTSPVQIRTMLTIKPPFAFIAPGRVYRSDSDSTHTPMFHQIEGVMIGEDITMANLKWLLQQFCNRFFGDDVTMRFRPSYFPFTEPSAEVDILNKNNSYLEVLGCGMIHPSVLKEVQIDHEQYQGFAFGLGVERFAMLKYGMDDIRKFFDCDTRWLYKNNFSPL